MPVITKATRIYTDTPEKVIKAGICLADVSDHLPVFWTMASTLHLLLMSLGIFETSLTLTKLPFFKT